MKIKTFSVQMMQFPAILFFIFGVDIYRAGLVPAKRPPKVDGMRPPEVDAEIIIEVVEGWQP